ncbi:cation:proton antiporter [Paracoccus sp. (in: a-proteobacteria)]|uniref:cation:proton antiporter n=1 Tax=Paracoccus sp. TaxID=267 RepID=UPI003A8B21E8
MTVIAIFLALVFGYSLISERIERHRLTAPIVFTGAGILTGLMTGAINLSRFEGEIFLTVAEIGLVLLLFTDGSRVSFRFRGDLRSLPGRLLTVGMFLSILLGLLAALLVFGDLTLWEAGILAAILAPTDAGLGRAIVSDARVPLPIRESLNIEAGLNDGLSVPFLLFFIAMASPAAGIGAGAGTGASLAEYFVQQFGVGLMIGLLVGGFGGRLYARAAERGTIGPDYRQLGFAALPMICVLACEVTGASMFIAAFVAGLATRGSDRKPGLAAHSTAFIENWGQSINLSVFYLFGLLVAGEWSQMTATAFAYAALSLTVVRMLPVAVALTGTGLDWRTVLFIGWFGPRGLASIVLGLVYLQNAAGQEQPTIRVAVMATVLSSILAHGMTAGPGVRRYAMTATRHPAPSPR